jgi:PAS domain-containing protein
MQAASSRTRPALAEATRVAAFAAGYLLTALLGRTTVLAEHDISMVWPAAAFSVLWVTARAGAPTRWIDFILIGLLTGAAVIVTGGSGAFIVTAGLAAVVQALVCDAIMRRACPRIWQGRGQIMLDRREMWRFFGAAIVAVCASAPLVEVDPLLTGRGWQWDLALLWVARNLGSLVVLVPLGLAIGEEIGPSRSGMRAAARRAIATARRTVRAHPGEWALVLVLSPASHVAWFLVVDTSAVAFPLLVLACWAGVRLPAALVAVHSALVAMAVVACTAAARGPFVGHDDPVLDVAIAQLYVVLACGMGLALALDRDDRARLSVALEAARDEARRQAALFGTIVDTMGEGLRVVDRDGHVIVRNPAASRLLLGSVDAGLEAGLPPEADLGAIRNLDGSPVPPEEMPYRRSLEGQDVRDLDLLVRSDDEERIVSFTTARLPEAAGGGVVTVLRDVTAERRELMRAARVQSGLLPTTTPSLPGYQLAARFVPAGSVGGDFYDWHGADHGVVLTLADVMGKGMGAAILAATTRSLLRAHGGDGDVTRPLRAAEEGMRQDLEGSSAFVTVFRAFVHAPTGDITYADAGHGLAAILPGVDGGAPSGGGVRRLHANGLPLGIAPDEARAADRERLARGETLLVVSDGVLDALGGSLDDLARAWDAARGAATAAEAVAAVVALAEAGSPDDDLTVLALRRER